MFLARCCHNIEYVVPYLTCYKDLNNVMYLLGLRKPGTCLSKFLAWICKITLCSSFRVFLMSPSGIFWLKLGSYFTLIPCINFDTIYVTRIQFQKFYSVSRNIYTLLDYCLWNLWVISKRLKKSLLAEFYIVIVM